MRETLELALDAIGIDQTAVVLRLGSPGGIKMGGQLQEALAHAEESLIATGSPRCVVETIDHKTLARIYDGEGNNDRNTPLEEILERAEAFALFAITLGPAVTDRITSLFNEHDYLTATLLDAMASSVTENLVESLETRFGRRIREGSCSSISPAVLAYSPGYCGWHVSGQKALFSALKPEQIDVTLGPGCMMRPLKSVSGVLVSGEPEVHDFDMIFSCCSGCDTLECRTRIERVTNPIHTKKDVAWTCLNK